MSWKRPDAADAEKMSMLLSEAGYPAKVNQDPDTLEVSVVTAAGSLFLIIVPDDVVNRHFISSTRICRRGIRVAVVIIDQNRDLFGSEFLRYECMCCGGSIASLPLDARCSLAATSLLLWGVRGRLGGLPR